MFASPFSRPGNGDTERNDSVKFMPSYSVEPGLISGFVMPGPLIPISRNLH